MNVRQVMTDLLGREVALVALPGDLGAAVVEGRDAASLQAGVDELVRIQQAAGDLTGGSTSTYKGVTIHSGTQKGRERFYAVSGKVLVASNRVEAVQKVIDVIQGAPSLAATARYKQASDVVKGAPVTGFLNGEALRPLARMLATGPGSALKAAAASWAGIMRARMADVLSQVDYAALGVSGDGGLTVQLTIAYTDGRIPEAVRSALPPPGSRMGILGLAPQSSVLVAARDLSPEGAWNYAVQTASDPANPAGEL